MQKTEWIWKKVTNSIIRQATASSVAPELDSRESASTSGRGGGWGAAPARSTARAPLAALNTALYTMRMSSVIESKLLLDLN